jgi:hypothetical protein
VSSPVLRPEGMWNGMLENYLRHCSSNWLTLWSSGQNSWLQIKRFGFYSRRYQFSGEVVGLERGPLSLVGPTEELLEKKNDGSGVEKRDYGRRYPQRWPRDTLYQQKVGTNFANKRRSVGIVRSQTKATELLLLLVQASAYGDRGKPWKH